MTTEIREDGLLCWTATIDGKQGVCKLIRDDDKTAEMLEADGDDAGEAWELIWVEHDTNVRRFECNLPEHPEDRVYLDRETVDTAKSLVSQAPNKIREAAHGLARRLFPA
jgi:hypothetical protein